MKQLSTYLFVIISLFVGSFFAGPGFGLANGMAVWYIMSYREQILRRWLSLVKMNSSLFGILVLFIVFIINIVFVSGLGLLVQSAMGPGKF